MISSRSVASLDMKTNCKHVLRYNGCTRWGSNCRKHHETRINTFVNVEIFRRHLSEKDISVPEFLAQGSRSIWSNDISGKNILWEVNGKNRLDYWILQISVSVAVCGTGYNIKISFFTNHPITYRVCDIIIKFSFFLYEIGEILSTEQLCQFLPRTKLHSDYFLNLQGIDKLINLL